LLMCVLALLCSCQNANRNQAGANQAQPEITPLDNRPTLDSGKTIRVTSTVFQEGGAIPKEYTCDGANVSPPLRWEGVPEKARTLVLIADDPDAPAKTWVHWVVFNLPAAMRELPENVAAQGNIVGAQGTNDFRKAGYGGPCPPNGTHRYFFKLYALDTELALDFKATKDQVLKAMEGHIIAEGQLMGQYSR
jgi:Raf kinase inhibitor-like YbhB/YbcL family protein